MRTLTITLITLFIGFFNISASAQGSIKSDDGYTVKIGLEATSIITSSSSCKWGYNYNLEIDYEVTFDGDKQPKKLYSLYGYYYCDGNENYFDIPETEGKGTVKSSSNVYRKATDCNTATPKSLDCGYIVMVIYGPGIKEQKFEMKAGALPVEFVQVETKRIHDLVAVKWTTASEINNQYFTIERSTDNINFEEIATVDGAGNSEKLLHYTYEDMSPLEGVVYYRVKQTDFDGQFDYSDVVTVEEGLNEMEVSVFPNPAKATNAILDLGLINQTKTIRIVDMTGQLVQEYASIESRVSVPDLKAGVYFISVSTSNGSQKTVRFIQE